jgi:hypothetical protein
VQQVLAMTYVSWYYNRQYSEDQEHVNVYATLLRADAEALLAGILDGSIVIPGQPLPTSEGISFYPNDASSALEPTDTDASLGGPSFTMTKVW